MELVQTAKMLVNGIGLISALQLAFSFPLS
jgi:hypothetical protein